MTVDHRQSVLRQSSDCLRVWLHQSLSWQWLDQFTCDSRHFKNILLTYDEEYLLFLPPLWVHFLASQLDSLRPGLYALHRPTTNTMSVTSSSSWLRTIEISMSKCLSTHACQKHGKSSSNFLWLLPSSGDNATWVVHPVLYTVKPANWIALVLTMTIHLGRLSNYQWFILYTVSKQDQTNDIHLSGLST